MDDINPFTLNTQKAREYQMIIQAKKPALAARLAKAVPPSMAYADLMHRSDQGEQIDVSKLPAELREEIQLRNGPELQAQREAAEAQMLADMEAKVAEMEKARGVNPDAAPVYRTWQERSAAEHRQHQQLEAEARRKYSPAGAV